MSEFKVANEKDLDLMKGFAQASDAMYEYISKFEHNEILKMIGIKLTEASQWFNTGVMNGGIKEAEQEQAH